MSVYLSPSNSLGFHRPLTTLVKRSLTITNSNAQPIAFKVKTTAPKLYCVRPNSGRVEPGESLEVSVMLQALKEEPPLNAKCKDKFLILSTLLTPEKETASGQDIWSASDGAPDDQKVFQQKLKVVYLPPEGQTVEEEDENQVNQSSMMNQGEPHFETVRQPSLTNGHVAPIPEFNEVSQEALRPSSPPAAFSVAKEEPQPETSTPAPISVFVQPPVEPSDPPHEQPRSLSPTPPNNELLAQLEEARNEIERLRGLLAAAAPPPELRKRQRRLSDDAMTAAPPSEIGTMLDEPLQQEGVPLQVVVIIALGVFITTYLFF